MSILSMNPTSHIFIDYPYPRSNTFNSDTSSATTVHHHRQCRTFSGSSFASDSTYGISSRQPRNAAENTRPLRTVQSTTYTRPQVPTLRKVVSQLPPRTLWSVDKSSSSEEVERAAISASLSTLGMDSLEDRVRTASLFDGFESIAELDAVEARVPQDEAQPNDEIAPDSAIATVAPFRKWLGTLRRKPEPYTAEFPHIMPADGREHDDHFVSPDDHEAPTSRPRASTAESSTRAFISAVKSATVTLAESSIAPRSWLGSLSKQLHRGKHSRSNTVDSTGTRTSIDQGIDDYALSRARQRRLILEELIETEESYVADLKVLQDIYTTLLPATSMQSHMRQSVRENLMQLIQLHNDLLGKLYEVVPHSEYNQKHAKETPGFHPKGHVRWRSADASPNTSAIAGRLMDSKLGRKLRHSLDSARPTLQPTIATASDPRVASAAGRLFGRHMKEFLIYEEYAGKYESMANQLACAYKELPTKEIVERGIEVLAHALQPLDARAEDGKKGLTFQDLLIKPIQRICKYPLLFNDLFKHTPIGDDPIAHTELGNLVNRFRGLAANINKATHDQRTKDLIEKTWLLQDRFDFGDQPEPLVLMRKLGHVMLCGVLHVAYQTRKEVKGQYMLCAQFRSCLILAVSEKTSPGYAVVACIPLNAIQLEEADNGRGLQCHTAPYSWKIVFSMERRCYEILFSACSPGEESRWRQSLCSLTETDGFHDASGIHTNLRSEFARDIKPLVGNHAHKPSLSTRISIRRAVTLGPGSQLSQVIIRNTSSAEQASPAASTSSLQIGRSQSLNIPGHIPILCPRRSERIQLELAMSDLYTKDTLPYPGMKTHESSFRASAQSIMRKLSMASISSTFSRRSVSLASLNSSRGQQRSASTAPDLAGRSQRSRLASAPRPVDVPRIVPLQRIPSATIPANPAVPVVDFHKNPDAFLPLDFSLRDPRVSTLPRHTALRTVTSKQVLADNPEVPNHRKLKRSISVQADPSQVENRTAIAARPNLLTTKSEVTRRRSIDVNRALDNIGFSQGLGGKENMLTVSNDYQPPSLGSEPSSTAIKPLSQRIRDFIR